MTLHVTDIGSPLYKVDFPGASHSQYGSKADLHGADGWSEVAEPSPKPGTRAMPGPAADVAQPSMAYPFYNRRSLQIEAAVVDGAFVKELPLLGMLTIISEEPSL